MNLPTNKLRDFITVLQTLDPDIDTDIISVEVVNRGRKQLKLTVDPEKADYIFLDRLSNFITTPNFEPDQDSLEAWAEAINKLGNDLTKLETNHADLQERYDEISYRLHNLKEILLSATNLLS